MPHPLRSYAPMLLPPAPSASTLPHSLPHATILRQQPLLQASTRGLSLPPPPAPNHPMPLKLPSHPSLTWPLVFSEAATFPLPPITPRLVPITPPLTTVRAVHPRPTSLPATTPPPSPLPGVWPLPSPHPGAVPPLMLPAALSLALPPPLASHSLASLLLSPWVLRHTPASHKTRPPTRRPLYIARITEAPLGIPRVSPRNSTREFLLSQRRCYRDARHRSVSS